MYCPQCGVEYREGFTACSDCGIPLVAGTPPPEPPSVLTNPRKTERPAPLQSAEFHGGAGRRAPLRSDPNLDLVVVLETNDRVQLAMAQGMLEDAGIPFFVLNQITTLVQDVDGFLRKWVRVQVPRDREAEARELLETLTTPEGTGEEAG